MRGVTEEKKPQKMVRSSIACARCRRSKVKCEFCPSFCRCCYWLLLAAPDCGCYSSGGYVCAAYASFTVEDRDGGDSSKPVIANTNQQYQDYI
jgi:hypothetical protein